MASTTPKLISDKNEMRNWSRSMRAQGKLIGFVPTMGFLHMGHLSLVSQARSLCDVVAVSIYVNPGQFAPSEDLSTYPSDFHGDLRKLASLPGGVDVVFHPHNLYDYGNNSGDAVVEEGGAAASCLESLGLGHESWVRVEKLEVGLCGKSRPHFFRGVATVVTKLFNIVEPDVAVFGKKDYQQWRVIQRMLPRMEGSVIRRPMYDVTLNSPFSSLRCGRCREVRDLDFSIKVIGAEIARENDGLAMSSRNVRLSPEEREKALSINKSLLKAKSAAEDGQVHCDKLKNLVIQCITDAGGRIDYAEIVDQNNLRPVEQIKGPVVFCIAAWFGKVRLIDNMEINLSMDD